MANPPAFWGPSNANLAEDSARVEQEPMTAEQPSLTPAPLPAMAGGNLLGAIATLLALTPEGRTSELERLSALAHGYIALASDDQLVALAKAVAGRKDMGHDLADRLAIASTRAAHTLVRANALSDEAIARLLEQDDQDLRALIARHHTLQGKHITMLVADGNGAVLQALLENRNTAFSADAQRLVTKQVDTLKVQLAEATQAANAGAPTASLPSEQAEQPSVVETQSSQPSKLDTDPTFDALRADWSAAIEDSAKARKALSADPRREARRFADLDEAGRRAVMHRLKDERAGTTSLAEARRALDPTRHDADLAFLTVIEQRDPAALGALFATTLSLPAAMVTRLLDEADGEALLVMSKAAGLSSTAFARMLILGKTGLTGSPRDTFALVDRFNALQHATAQMIVKAMRDGAASSQSTPVNPAAHRRQLEPIREAKPTDKIKPRPITALANQGFRRAV